MSLHEDPRQFNLPPLVMSAEYEEFQPETLRGFAFRVMAGGEIGSVIHREKDHGEAMKWGEQYAARNHCPFLIASSVENYFADVRTQEAGNEASS